MQALGRIYVPDADGILQPTDGMLKKMADNGIIEPIENSSDPHARVKSLLHYSPDWFIGKDVYKDFPDHGGVYHGLVMSTRLVPDTDKVVWRILYDDKDTEDFTAEQMIDYCILKVDGTTSAPAPAETATPAAPAAAETQPERSAAPPSAAPAADTNKPADPDASPVVPRDTVLFKDVELYTTSNKQTFFDICRNMGLPQAQWKAYYEWVSDNFYRGHRWNGVDGAVHFYNPWGGCQATVTL